MIRCRNIEFFVLLVPQKTKPDRWIEIASPYINYPSPSVLNMYVYSLIFLYFISYTTSNTERQLFYFTKLKHTLRRNCDLCMFYINLLSVVLDTFCCA